MVKKKEEKITIKAKLNNYTYCTVCIYQKNKSNQYKESQDKFMYHSII